MDLMSMILNANKGGNVRELASSFGLDEGQAQSAIAALVPALSQGLKRNMTQQGGSRACSGRLQAATTSATSRIPAR